MSYIEGRRGWKRVEEGGRGWKRVEEGGRGWKRVEEGRRGWKRVEESGRGWKRVEEGLIVLGDIQKLRTAKRGKVHVADNLLHVHVQVSS